jgi:glycosyltransferase, family 2
MIENKKIDILMATYNGEKYLAEQLDSIINQTYHNWNLLIRDDNSTDRTLEIIQDYQKKDNRIKLLKDNKGNLGIVKNFEELLKNSESEFIMFSDQDDIWVENKLDMYLKMIEKIKNKGFMIHSDAILFDKNKSNILKDTFISKKAINKGLENVFFNYFVQGATILISKEIKNFILPFPKEVYLHDRYIHLISELFFERIFVNKALIYYRQHGDNQIGAKNTIRELLSKRYFDERDRQLIKVIYNKYGSLLTEDKKKLIEEYFKITDIEKNRFNRFLNLKKSKINIPLKKQISFIVKG